MLEIIILIFLTRHIGNLAKQKGLNISRWKFTTVAAWLTGEILGVMLGIIFFGVDRPWMAMLVGLPCAVAGYHIVRTMINNYPDVLTMEMDELGEHLES